MKEQGVYLKQAEGQRLTNPAHNPRLRREQIFMAEDQGELQVKPQNRPEPPRGQKPNGETQAQPTGYPMQDTGFSPEDVAQVLTGKYGQVADKPTEETKEETEKKLSQVPEGQKTKTKALEGELATSESKAESRRAQREAALRGETVDTGLMDAADGDRKGFAEISTAGITNQAIKDLVTAHNILVWGRAGSPGEVILTVKDIQRVLRENPTITEDQRRMAEEIINTLGQQISSDTARRLAEAEKERARMFQRRGKDEEIENLENDLGEFDEIATEAARRRGVDITSRRVRTELEGDDPVLRAIRNDLIKAIKDAIGKAPSIETSYFDPDLIKIASRFAETREMLINRIIFKPFEDKSERNQYDPSLYAQSNLDALLGYLNREDRERYEYYISLRTAAMLFHTMNARIRGGNLERFIELSESISYKHFNDMRSITGVGEVMRLFEQKYFDYLARYKTISQARYEQLMDDVEDDFRLLNDNELVISAFANQKEGEPIRLAEWELERALNVGRTFFNISFRSAEQIASGRVPRPVKHIDEKGNVIPESEVEVVGEGEKQFSSFPLEGAVRIMNWIQWLNYRFQISAPRGGLEFLADVKKNYFKRLRDTKVKLGINKITDFCGMNVDELEVGGMFGISGIYSSWRIDNMAFPTIKIRVNGRDVTVREWLNENDRAIQIARNMKEKEATMTKKQQELLQVLTPLIDNFSSGLGILLKHSIADGEIGYEVRKRIWEKVAVGNVPRDQQGNLIMNQKTEELELDDLLLLQGNMPLMIDYLSNFKISDNGIESLEQIKRRIGSLQNEDWDARDPNNLGNMGKTRWEVFVNKIKVQHEINVKKAAGITIGNVENQKFSAQEKEMLRAIKNNAVKLAPHLADIAFPYLPFMNDIPFELLSYTEPGEEFYKRRAGSDIPSYNKAEGAFTAVMDNPGGIGTEEAVKQFHAIVKGIESPSGTTLAQERVFPMFQTWLEWNITKSKDRWIFKKALKQTFHRPTSIAQEKSGPDADSISEFEVADLIIKSAKAGILIPALAHELRKKLGVNLLMLIISAFKNAFLIPIVTGGWQFGKATSKGLVVPA